MNDPVGPGRPPTATRFRKGQSGNPKGRPRAKPPAPNSAFDVILDRMLTLTQGGIAREVTIEEALQLRTYQKAIEGDKMARREVLRMIAEREAWFAKKSPRAMLVERLIERTDPYNVHGAMILLGIADQASATDQHDGKNSLLLQQWAVQAALSRRGSKSLSAKDVSEIKGCTRDAQTLSWPKGAGE